MRVLFVEDDVDWLEEVSAEFRLLDSSVSIAAALSSASAVALIENEDEEFDLIICDLRIPPSDGGLAIDENQGLFVQARARDTRPGVPCMFLTARASARNIRDRLSLGGKSDIFGTGQDFPMVVYFSKEELPEAIAWISDFMAKRHELSIITVSREEETLIPDYVEHGLRIFARRRGGSTVHVQPIGGGLSGAGTYKVTVNGPTGARAVVFAKFDSRSAVLDEITKYEQCLPSLLGPNTFASFADKVTDGLGTKSGIFYQLATGFDRSLFDLMAEDDSKAGVAVAKLQQKVEPWLNMRAGGTSRIRDFRREAVLDSVLDAYMEAKSDFDHEAFEERSVTISKCFQHGDLHGANILVDLDGEPLMIDFGNLGSAPACLDPIVLELSILFHPDARKVIGEWATSDLASHWFDVERWAASSPVPEFIRACRNWASTAAGGELEMFSVAYCEALRQLKYDDTDKDLAVAIALSARRAGVIASQGLN